MAAGLTPVMPSGALYMMVGVELDKFPHITTAVDFMDQLMLEESVYILPGEVSSYKEQYSNINQYTHTTRIHHLANSVAIELDISILFSCTSRSL